MPEYKKYLVTGGAGFIGSHLVEELVRRQYQVRVLDDFSSGKEENLAGLSSKIEIIRGDIRNKDLCLEAAAGNGGNFTSGGFGFCPQVNLRALSGS